MLVNTGIKNLIKRNFPKLNFQQIDFLILLVFLKVPRVLKMWNSGAFQVFKTVRFSLERIGGRFHSQNSLEISAVFQKLARKKVF